ncbi:MAG: response regulator transcription factor, partial [Burkholderiales bacterium]|nr:response regulator transcription factor [Burkholderiales bacterium]
GICAFVNKAAAPDLMLQLLGRAIQDELEGHEWLSASGPCDFNELSTFHLTSRQLQVLGLIAQGLTNRQIADRLGIIEATAKAHVSAIFRELGVTNRTQALLKARRLGL